MAGAFRVTEDASTTGLPDDRPEAMRSSERRADRDGLAGGTRPAMKVGRGASDARPAQGRVGDHPRQVAHPLAPHPLLLVATSARPDADGSASASGDVSRAGTVGGSAPPSHRQARTSVDRGPTSGATDRACPARSRRRVGERRGPSRGKGVRAAYDHRRPVARPDRLHAERRGGRRTRPARLPRRLVRPLPADAAGDRATDREGISGQVGRHRPSRPSWPSATRSRPSPPSSSSTPRAARWRGPRACSPPGNSRSSTGGQGEARGRAARRRRPPAGDAADRRGDGPTEADADAGGGSPGRRAPSPPRRPSPIPSPGRRSSASGPRAGSIGFGSGTIIHSTPQESIILTCAHIFKLEGGRSPQPSRFPGRSRSTCSTAS